MSIIINELSSEVLEQVDAALAPTDRRAEDEAGSLSQPISALRLQRLLQERKARMQED